MLHHNDVVSEYLGGRDMQYKLKNNNGIVNALLHTGNDFVKDVLKVSAAQHIISTGTLVESDREGYPICVDNTWYFEGEPVEEPKPEKLTENSVYGSFGKNNKRGKK